MTDTIADFLTRIRNAVMAKHRIVEVPTSKVKKEITKILFNKGYILSYKFDDDSRTIKIALKYNPATRRSAITGIKRVSSPGLRKYEGCKELPPRAQWSRHRDRFHLQGHHDRQGGKSAERRRRGNVLRLLI